MDILDILLLSPPFTIEASQQGALVGFWSDVTYLQARSDLAILESRNPTFKLESGSDRHTLEARNGNLE